MKKRLIIILTTLSLSYLVSCNFDLNTNSVISNLDNTNVITDSTETNTENTSIEKKTTQSSGGKIIMPNNSSDYIGSKYTIDTLTEHFSSLGFTNITTIPYKPNDKDYNINIKEVIIKTGWVKSKPWKAGEEYKSDDEISIFYNESPMLTVDNCPDLITVLTSKNINYIDFADKYDGQYVQFDAYVSYHSYDPITGHIIDVTGGDYDGVSELGKLEEKYYNGLIIRIGERNWNGNIDEGVEIGQNVTVSGIIEASWSEYYKTLYVEGLYLSKR